MQKLKSIIILSYKSSGSSACQYLLSKAPEINHVSNTRHQFNETLFWSKSASILDMPLTGMIDTEVPFDREKATTDLIKILGQNIESYSAPEDEEELVFEGWVRLCREHSPVFIEKSPHHLFQWSALELMARCTNELSEVDFQFVGLVRNPMDVLYSANKRWGTPPEFAQYEWLESYRNLLRFQELVGDKLLILRYEDMVTDLEFLEPVFDFTGNSVHDLDQSYLHAKSLSKWRFDDTFRFALAEEVIELAEKYGYREQDVIQTVDNLILINS